MSMVIARNVTLASYSSEFCVPLNFAAILFCRSTTSFIFIILPAARKIIINKQMLIKELSRLPVKVATSSADKIYFLQNSRNRQMAMLKNVILPINRYTSLLPEFLVLLFQITYKIVICRATDAAVSYTHLTLPTKR